MTRRRAGGAVRRPTVVGLRECGEGEPPSLSDEWGRAEGAYFPPGKIDFRTMANRLTTPRVVLPMSVESGAFSI